MWYLSEVEYRNFYTNVHSLSDKSKLITNEEAEKRRLDMWENKNECYASSKYVFYNKANGKKLGGVFYAGKFDMDKQIQNK